MAASSATTVEKPESGVTTILRHFDPERELADVPEFDPERELAALGSLEAEFKGDPEGVAASEPEAPGGSLLAKLKPASGEEGVTAFDRNQSAAGEVKARMGIFRRYTDLLSALVVHPSMEAPDSEKASTLLRLIVQADRVAMEFSKRLTKGLQLENTNWVVTMTSRLAATLVADRWKAAGDTNIHPILDEVARIVPVGDGIKDVESFVIPDRPSLPDMTVEDNRRAALRMSMLSAMTTWNALLMSKVVPPGGEAKQQDIRKEWMERMRNALLDSLVVNPTLKNDFQNCSHNERVMLIQNQIGCSAKLMETALACELAKDSPSLGRVISGWRDAMNGLMETVEVEIKIGNHDGYAVPIGMKVGR